MAAKTRTIDHGVFDILVVAEKDLKKHGAAGYQVVGVGDSGVIVSKQVGVQTSEIPDNTEEPDEEEA